MIRIVDGAFRLNERIVFPGTTWCFQRGEQWAVAGENGSGKSLFLEALRGKLPLVRGELDYTFRPPPGFSHEEALAHLAFEEDPVMHGAVLQARWNSIEEDGAISVSEFLAYNRLMEVSPYEVTDRHIPARRFFERRLKKIIRLLEIEHLLPRRLIALSSGERKKVRLAGALARPSRMLLLDEPFMGLDRLSIRHFRKTLQTLADHGFPMLVATTRPQDLPPAFNNLLQLANLRVIGTAPLAPKNASSRGAAGHPVTKRSSPQRSDKILVQFRNIQVAYGSAPVIEGLDWIIREHERWALLGSNGSGKSTLIGLITGDHPQASSNDICIFGMQPGSGCPVHMIKRRLGMVSPELHLYFSPEMTCSDVVVSGFSDTLGLYESPRAGQRKKAVKWLSKVGLGKLCVAPFGTLSLGEQRLVLLARALVKEPGLLLLDEPCQGLDEAHRRRILNLVDGCALKKSALVYVTHRDDELPQSIRHTLRLPVSI